MPGAAHRFEFVGKEPVVLWLAVSLLFANTALMLAPDSLVKHLFAWRGAGAADWYAEHSIAIQFGLLLALAIIFLLFRRRVRYIPPR